MKVWVRLLTLTFTFLKCPVQQPQDNAGQCPAAGAIPPTLSTAQRVLGGTDPESSAQAQGSQGTGIPEGLYVHSVRLLARMCHARASRTCRRVRSCTSRWVPTSFLWTCMARAWCGRCGTHSISCMLQPGWPAVVLGSTEQSQWCSVWQSCRSFCQCSCQSRRLNFSRLRSLWLKSAGMQPVPSQRETQEKRLQGVGHESARPRNRSRKQVAPRSLRELSFTKHLLVCSVQVTLV